ncbi:hypothetical protein HYR54_17760 [Candidatus Acetothermia bacterium]|nr:hypothetical protein [Candidatus Acetothermia bacterium]
MRQPQGVRSGRWLAELATGAGRSLFSFCSKRVGRVGMARGWLVALVLGALGLGVLAGCTGFFQNLVGTDNKGKSGTTQLVTWHGQNGAQQACLEKLNDKELAKKLRHVLGKSEAKKLKKKLEQKGHKMRKDKAHACRTRTQNTTAAASGQLVPLQETGPDLTLTTIPFENTDGTSAALYDLQNEVDQSQQATWAGIEEGERYEHLQGDGEKSYLFPGATPTQQAITDAQQSEGFQEIQQDLQAQGLSLMNEGIQVVVDEQTQETLLVLPATSASTTPASKLGKASPTAGVPASYYYAWTNVDQVAVSGAAQILVGSLQVMGDTLSWFRDADLDDPAQLMSPYNWTSRFATSGRAATVGSSRCNSRGKLKINILNRSIAPGTSPYNVTLGVTVSGGKGPYTVAWDYGDGSINRFDNRCNKREVIDHTYFNIAGFDIAGTGVEAVYSPQIAVADNVGTSKTIPFTGLRRVRSQPGRFSPRDPNMPIVLIAGIGTTADGQDYKEVVKRLNQLGYLNVFVVDWAYGYIRDLQSGLIRPAHLPAMAALETQRLIHEKLDSKFGPGSKFIAIGLSGGGVAMRFLIEHPGADVVALNVLDSLPHEGWDDSRYPPWYGDGNAYPDVAPCANCAGLGFNLPMAWKDRVVHFYMLASPNHGTPAARYDSIPPGVDRCSVYVPVSLDKGTPGYHWGTSCADLATYSKFLDAMGYQKPFDVNVDYVAVGSDANDGLAYALVGSICLNWDCGIIIHTDSAEYAPWSYYSGNKPDPDSVDYGFDGYVPAQSSWVEGASHFILWDGDDPIQDGILARSKGTNVHNICLIANLWLWNRLIEHIEGLFDKRPDASVYGEFVYSGEHAISGGADPNKPQPMFQPPPRWDEQKQAFVEVNCGQQ